MPAARRVRMAGASGCAASRNAATTAIAPGISSQASSRPSGPFDSLSSPPTRPAPVSRTPIAPARPAAAR